MAVHNEEVEIGDLYVEEIRIKISCLVFIVRAQNYHNLRIILTSSSIQ